MGPMLLGTPFHSRTATLVRAQTWRRWAGHQLASAYDPHPDREYAAIRNAAALVDVSRSTSTSSPVAMRREWALLSTPHVGTVATSGRVEPTSSLKIEPR